MWTVVIRLATMIVENVFGRVPGGAYDVPAGCIFVDVPKNSYVGKGFTATQPAGADQPWTFTPPPADEPPPEPATVQEQLDAAQTKLDEAQSVIAALRAQLG